MGVVVSMVDVQSQVCKEVTGAQAPWPTFGLDLVPGRPRKPNGGRGDVERRGWVEVRGRRRDGIGGE